MKMFLESRVLFITMYFQIEIKMEAAKLRSYLECPVCFLLPRSSIFVCINGHKICESCFTKFEGVGGAKTCPQGGCIYNMPPRRARDAEAIIENSNLNLSCNRSGCNVEMKKDELMVHEIKCDFRKVPCPCLRCEKEIQFKTIDLHIRESHKNSNSLQERIFKPLMNETILTEPNQKWVLFTYHEAGFVFYPSFVKQDGLWYFWMKMKTDQHVAAKWRFHAKAENEENELSVEFTGHVQPIDLGLGEILALVNTWSSPSRML